MLSATQGLAKLSFFKYVDFEMMDHNNRAGAYEWGLQTLNISIEVCATWSNHSEKCTKWKYIKKAAGMKENKQRNIDKTLYGLGKIYSSCIWIISFIFICVYIYIYSKHKKISYLIISSLWRTDLWINTPPLQITGLCLCTRTRTPQMLLMPWESAHGAGAALRGAQHPCPDSGRARFMWNPGGTPWKIHLVVHYTHFSHVFVRHTPVVSGSGQEKSFALHFHWSICFPLSLW